MRQATLPQRRHVIFVVLAFTCVVALSIALRSSGSKATSLQDDPPKIINETQSLQVTRIEKKDMYYEIRLKNVSQKNINGYIVALGDNGEVMRDMTIGGRVIAPGEEDDFIIPTDSRDKAKLKITTVIFDDGTFDGAAKGSSEFTNRRLGLRIQLKRVLALIDKTLNSPEVDSPAALAKLRANLSSLQTRSNNVLPPISEQGLHDVRETALRMLQEVEDQQLQGRVSIREGLVHIKEQLKKWSDSLEKGSDRLDK